MEQRRPLAAACDFLFRSKGEGAVPNPDRVYRENGIEDERGSHSHNGGEEMGNGERAKGEAGVLEEWIPGRR